MTLHDIRVLVAFMLGLAGVAIAIQPGQAHKAITSRYTYNDDVFPILRDRCASCHVAGGVAPMSLMTYGEAIPWAESIRAELIAAHMPPWNADEGYGEIKRVHTVTPKELDVLLTWATGNTPRGAVDQKLPVVELRNEWTLGVPDLLLRLPSAVTLAADQIEAWQEFTLPTGEPVARWIRAVDLLPGTPSIVRSATIVVKTAGTTAAPGRPVPEQVLALWLPGRDLPPNDGVAFKLPAGAQIGLRVHYKKTWQFEGKPLTDRSTVGVYFTPSSRATELLALPIEWSTAGAGAADQTIHFSQTLAGDVQALALSPDQVPANISLKVEAVRPDKSRVPMLRLNTRADWNRRYWFEKPIALPRGTRVEVAVNLRNPDRLGVAFAATSDAATATPSSMRLTLNVIPADAAPATP